MLRTFAIHPNMLPTKPSPQGQSISGQLTRLRENRNFEEYANLIRSLSVDELNSYDDKGCTELHRVILDSDIEAFNTLALVNNLDFNLRTQDEKSYDAFDLTLGKDIDHKARDVFIRSLLSIRKKTIDRSHIISTMYGFYPGAFHILTKSIQKNLFLDETPINGYSLLEHAVLAANEGGSFEFAQTLAAMGVDVNFQRIDESQLNQKGRIALQKARLYSTKSQIMPAQLPDNVFQMPRTPLERMLFDARQKTKT